MNIDKNDPRLMDLALGELEESEARALLAALDDPGNAEARRELDMLRALVRTASDALSGEAAGAGVSLRAEQRAAVLEHAASGAKENLAPATRQRAFWRRLAMPAAAAAAILVFVAGGAFLLTPPDEREHLAGLPRAETPETAEAPEAAEAPAPAAVPELALADPVPPAPLSEPLPETAPLTAPQPEPLSEPRPEPRPAERTMAGAAPRVLQTEPQLQPQYQLEHSRISPHDMPMADIAPPPPPVAEPAPHPGSGGGDSIDPGSTMRIRPEMSMHFPGGERYAPIAERPFAQTALDPLSTFSLHASTAAYANVRRFLVEGRMPPADAVRTEEIVNYFDYAYPEPAGPHPFTIQVETAPCPWAPGRLLAKIGLRARSAPRAERPPANLVFLIDVSGSMNRPNRLPLVKESMKTLVGELRPDDRVGIVTYAGESAVLLEAATVGESRETILRSIEGLRAAGTTHGSAGIQDAYAMAQRNFIEEGVNRVILATDGDFNVGVTSREGLVALVEEKRETGVFLTVLGYGMGNLKDDTLELLANAGNGHYAYIDSYREARRVLVEQIEGTLVTVAKDAKIQVEFNPARIHSYRLIGYENRMLAAHEFNDDQVDAGEIGAGHTVTALYELVPHGAHRIPGVDPLRYQPETDAPETAPADPSDELFYVKLRYKRPDGDESALMTVPAVVEEIRHAGSRDFRFAAAAAAFGMLLRDSPHKGSATFEQVRAAVEETLRESSAPDQDRREEFLDLVVRAKTLSGR